MNTSINCEPERESDIQRILGLIERHAARMGRAFHGGLSEPQRIVSPEILSRFEVLKAQGLSCGQIADKTGFCKSTVATHIRNARLVAVNKAFIS